MKVTWDPKKARSNKLKHRVRFPDVEAVFHDPVSLVVEDLSSLEERRFVAMGRGMKGQIYVVVYTYGNDHIRLISARKASKSESGSYEERVRL